MPKSVGSESLYLGVVSLSRVKLPSQHPLRFPETDPAASHSESASVMGCYEHGVLHTAACHTQTASPLDQTAKAPLKTTVKSPKMGSEPVSIWRMLFLVISTQLLQFPGPGARHRSSDPPLQPMLAPFP